MIRSSALLTAVAMVMLVAGVSAANLALIYVSIAVSIIAAVTLAVGVLLRRRELFGETGAAPQRDQPGRAAAETARPVPVRPAADDRVTADHGARREDSRRDGQQPGDLAARLRKAGPGAAAATGSARWPASIAAKAAPATPRGGEQAAGGGGVIRSPAGRGPAPREPARGDRAGRERDDRDPAAPEPVAREAAGREPASTGSTERGAGRPPRPGSAAGPGRPAEPGRDRPGAGRGQGPARPDREHAAPSRGRGDRDRAAAARADRAQTPPGHDRDHEAPARRDRKQVGRGRGEAAAGQQAEAFRLPPQSELPRARAEPGRAIPGEADGGDFRDRASEEFVDPGRQDPVRPAWPATAGPRAMGAGSAARRAPGETGDEPERAGPAEPRQPEPVPWEREAVPPPPDEAPDRGEQPAGAGAEAPWVRVVPPYVDDLAGRGQQQREPERQPAGADEPGEDAARTGAAARPAASGDWSAWSGTRAGDQGPGADAGAPGHDAADRGASQDERAAMQAPTGAAAGTEPGAQGETGDGEAGAGVPGDAAVVETADRAAAGGAAPGEAARPGADRPGETAGGTAKAESEAAPGSAHDAADTSRAAAAGDAGDAGESGAAGADADGPSPLDDQVTVVPGVPRYHRRGCILIRFLSDGDLEISTRRAAEAAGLVPCKACQPDKPASAG